MRRAGGTTEKSKSTGVNPHNGVQSFALGWFYRQAPVNETKSTESTIHRVLFAFLFFAFSRPKPIFKLIHGEFDPSNFDFG